MRTRTQTLLIVAALVGSGLSRARAQDTTVDPRWLAYVGCWEQVGAAKSQVCVVPAAGTSTAVDLVTVAKGEVTARERIAATGQRIESTGGNCAGWHSADWSARGQRLFLRSEDTCDNTRVGTGLIAMSGNGEWLYIQGMTIGGQTGVRVQRYREATGEFLLPGDVADALRLAVSSTIQARAAAGAPLSTDDVVDASKHVDTAVLEAWLVERAEPFTLDAKRLVALADARVPARVIDLMVALSYPRVFAINAASRQGERLAPQKSSDAGTGSYSRPLMLDPLCSGYDYMYPYLSLYPYISPYPYYSISSAASYDCSGLGRGYGYGSGYGWYPGGYPVTIIYGGSSGGSSRSHGRVINGGGYDKGDDAGAGQSGVPRRSDPASRPASGSTAGSTGSGTASTSSSGSGEHRTAKPRPR